MNLENTFNFEEVVSSIINGSFTQAANKCIEYSFTASELDEALREHIKFHKHTHIRGFELAIDLFYVIEIMAKISHKDMRN